jgi:hypothetical protein
MRIRISKFSFERVPESHGDLYDLATSNGKTYLLLQDKTVIESING